MTVYVAQHTLILILPITLRQIEVNPPDNSRIRQVADWTNCRLDSLRTSRCRPVTLQMTQVTENNIGGGIHELASLRVDQTAT